MEVPFYVARLMPKYVLLFPRITCMTYVSIEGKASNFAHDALKYVCLAVYYSNSVKSLRQFAEFQQHVPSKALLLVAAVISFFF